MLDLGVIVLHVSVTTTISNSEKRFSKIGTSSLVNSLFPLYDRNLSDLVLTLLLFNLCLVLTPASLPIHILEIYILTNKIYLSIFKKTVYTLNCINITTYKGNIPVSGIYCKSSIYYFLGTIQNHLNINMQK